MPRLLLDKARPVDYLVLILGPALFLLIAWYGIQSLLGPPPTINSVQKLRDGAARVGMSEGELLKAVGPPKSVSSRPDGVTYRYQHSAWDPERKVFIDEDAFVDVDTNGGVTGISFESRTPEPPK